MFVKSIHVVGRLDVDSVGPSGKTETAERV